MLQGRPEIGERGRKRRPVVRANRAQPHRRPQRHGRRDAVEPRRASPAEGAHLGQGLGQKFLRHVERTRVLVHLVDLAPMAGPEGTEQDFATILGEIRSFGHGVDEKPRVTVYSKADLVPDAEARAAELNARLGVSGYPISGVTGLNLDRLLEDCWRHLQQD